MIWHPKPGMRVRIHYRAMPPYLVGYDDYPYRGRTGIVTRVNRGLGPINAEVRLDGDGVRVCEARGNLIQEEKP